MAQGRLVQRRRSWKDKTIRRGKGYFNFILHYLVSRMLLLEISPFDIARQFGRRLHTGNSLARDLFEYGLSAGWSSYLLTRP